MRVPEPSSTSLPKRQMSFFERSCLRSRRPISCHSVLAVLQGARVLLQSVFPLLSIRISGWCLSSSAAAALYPVSLLLFRSSRCSRKYFLLSKKVASFHWASCVPCGERPGNTKCTPANGFGIPFRRMCTLDKNLNNSSRRFRPICLEQCYALSSRVASEFRVAAPKLFMEPEGEASHHYTGLA